MFENRTAGGAAAIVIAAPGADAPFDPGTDDDPVDAALLAALALAFDLDTLVAAAQADPFQP